MILAMLDTGARAGEMIALNMADVDLRTGTVLIRCGKRRKPRATFLGVRSLRVMARYLRYQRTATNAAPASSPKGGRRLSHSGLRDILRRPTPHAFRRGFAILSLRKGAGVYSRQRFLGHTSLQVMRRYRKQTEEDLQEALRRTDPVDNLLEPA